MRVGLVRNAALGMVALVGLGLAGCDDTPTDFESDETVAISANPSVMVLPAGITATLQSRTENQGRQPTWEEVSASVDGSCGPGAVSVDVAADFEPSIQPPGVFDVTGGTTLGETCIQLSGGGANATVEVTVVGDSLAITGAQDTLNLNESLDLGAELLADDGTAVGPFDDVADIVWTSDNEDVLTVDQNGVVTAVGVGGALITATWSDFGVTRTASVAIAVNAPTLEITNAPSDSLLIFTSVDLDAELINPTDPPADFGPFDHTTDVTWSTSDDEVVTVDEMTGEATAVGPGTATITAVWNGNATVTDAVDIDVDVPAPTLTSTDVASAEALETVTITGTDFIPGAHTVLINGALMDPFFEPTVSSTTTATFLMPAGAAEDVSVTVGIPGVESNALDVSRTCGATFDDCASEPANDDPGAAPPVSLPVSIAGIVSDPDPDDFFAITLAAETTFQIDLSWTGPSGDLDLLVVDTGVTTAECGGVTATGNVPESGECTLPAGDYLIWVNSFDHEIGVYQLDIVEVP